MLHSESELQSPNTGFETALARFVDEEPEPGDCALLEESIRASPELLKQMSGALALDELLRQHVEPRSEFFVESLRERLKTENNGAVFVEQLKGKLKPRSRWARWAPWVLAVASCLVAAFSFWHMSQTTDKQPSALVGANLESLSPDSMALIVNHIDSKFAPGAGPQTVSFSPGDYSLVEGTVHMRFRNGADVVIVAPTHFSILDALHVKMKEGTLRALVPESAYGFVVETPDIIFKDRGTEFGVIVKAGSNQSELHVFDGQVDVYKNASKTPDATCMAGESVSVVKGLLQPLPPASDAQFPTINSISLRRWNTWRERFQRESHLVFYFPFLENAENPKILENFAENGRSVSGQIEGAQWVTGRWPGKKALQFENSGDGVALNIPDEYQQISLAAWIKIDRLENSANAILNSVGWRKGNIQWQVDRRGSPAVTSAFSSPKRTVDWIDGRIPIGQWIHWVVTMDRNNGQILHYLNGQRICSARVTPETTILKPGQCYIGRWSSDNKSPENRDFRGRIDEMAMWSVALTADEISRLAKAGMPIPEDISPDSNVSDRKK